MLLIAEDTERNALRTLSHGIKNYAPSAFIFFAVCDKKPGTMRETG
jgi:hypothetical protein